MAYAMKIGPSRTRSVFKVFFRKHPLPRRFTLAAVGLYVILIIVGIQIEKADISFWPPLEIQTMEALVLRKRVFENISCNENSPVTLTASVRREPVVFL